MSLARIVFMSKKLRKKFGVVGIVASKYIEAGFSVHIGFRTSKGEVSFIAKKEGKTYAVDVVSDTRTVTDSDIRSIYEKAKSINAKPIIVIYGKGPKVTDTAKDLARNLGVEIKYVKP